MPAIPTAITDLSTTAASNAPSGSDSPSTLDDIQRAHGSFIRQLHTGAVTTTANITSGTITGTAVSSTSGALNGSLGATTPSTVAATTISASGTSTLRAIGGTYLNGTTVLQNAANSAQAWGITNISGAVYVGYNNGADHDVLGISSTGLAVTGDVSPEATGTRKLGSTSLRWSEVWCTAGAFNTSDARLKTEVTLLNEAEKKAAAQFSREIGTFQWIDSVKLKGADKARHHVGFTVQRAQEILESFGLDPWRYGFMSYDQWGDEFMEHPAIEAVDAVLDEEGNVVTPAIEAKAAWTEKTKTAGDAYAFRYDQLNLFVAAGISYRLEQLEAA